jgi:hypothetical protein
MLNQEVSTLKRKIIKVIDENIPMIKELYQDFKCRMHDHSPNCAPLLNKIKKLKNQYDQNVLQSFLIFNKVETLFSQ